MSFIGGMLRGTRYGKWHCPTGTGKWCRLAQVWHSHLRSQQHLEVQALWHGPSNVRVVISHTGVGGTWVLLKHVVIFQHALQKQDITNHYYDQHVIHIHITYIHLKWYNYNYAVVVQDSFYFVDTWHQAFSNGLVSKQNLWLHFMLSVLRWALTVRLLISSEKAPICLTVPSESSI